MLSMYNFKTELINLINSSNLTIEQIYYILQDLFGDITRQYNVTIQRELEKKEIETKEKEEEKTDGENQEN